MTTRCPSSLRNRAQRVAVTRFPEREPAGAGQAMKIFIPPSYSGRKPFGHLSRPSLSHSRGSSALILVRDDRGGRFDGSRRLRVLWRFHVSLGRMPEELGVDALALAVNLLRRGAEAAEHGLGECQRHFPFGREHGLGPGLA